MGKNNKLEIEFLGAAGTVTGSRTLLRYNHKQYLVDCGLFQGPKHIREKNWQEFEQAKDIEAIFLTHAHIDHSGYIPKLVKEGFRGPIYCSEATSDLAQILLMDSAHLQEEDARFLNKKGVSSHHPALPLYTEQDALVALEYLKPVEKDKWIEIDKGLSIRLQRSGHILGSTFIEVSFAVGNGVKVLTFSGDIGNNRQNVIKGPVTIKESDYLVMESTYGDRSQPRGDIMQELADIIRPTVEAKGVVVIPAFAVGRTQELLYLLRELEEAHLIPDTPVFVDSPMANNSTDIYLRHSDDLKLADNNGKLDRPLCPQEFTPVRSADESMLLCMRDGPMIVLSAAGMLTGGRVLHHLRRRLPDPKNAVIFVGYQVEETKGRLLQQGLPKIRIHKEIVDVEARVESVSTLSAHGDSQDIIDWISRFQTLPKKIFLNHGEPPALNAMKYRIEYELGVPCTVAQEGQKFVLE